MAIVDMGGGGEPAEGVGAHRFFRRTVNSQSKFHRWMGAETSEGNQRNLRWERGENKSIITHIQHKEGKKAHSNKPEKEVSQT